MATLPLYINGQLITIDQLSGFNYVVGYPELAALIAAHGATPMFGWTREAQYVYPLPGTQRLWTLPGRSWRAGTRLRASRFGANSDWRTLTVISYDRYTGEMYAEITASTAFTLPVTGGQGYYLTPYAYEPISSTGALPASYGTGGFTVDDARAGLLLPNPSNYLCLFNDFVFPDSSIKVGTASATQQYTSFLDDGENTNNGIDYGTHPGVFTFGSSNNVTSLYFGKYYGPWTDMTGDNTFFEIDVLFPKLSSSGNYVFNAGLIGPNANVRVSYTDNVNSGRFVLQHGINGGLTSVNTTVTMAINTWYRIRLDISSTNIRLLINGSPSATASKTNYQNVAPTNLMIPTVRSIGAAYANSVMTDYMFFLKHFPTAR